MDKELFLGIDVGTTTVKAGLFNKSGVEISSWSAPYPTHHKGAGYVEQDPENWVDLINQAIFTFDKTSSLEAIKAIGITSQVNTHIFVDANHTPLTPAILWQDTRCAPEAEFLDDQITEAQKMAWWGAPMPLDTSHCLARMRWMQQHRPQIWHKTRYVLLPKDYCILKLTGQLVSDPTSNIGLVDQDNCYIPALLDLVPDAASRLPPLKQMNKIAGIIKSGHPLAGKPVAVCTMDAWAGMFGVGTQKDTQAYYLSGTSEILGIISQKTVPTAGILVFPQTQNIRVHAAPTQSGGASIQWFCNLFDTTPQKMAQMVETLDPEQPVPLFLPHLAGERAPLWDPNTRGTLLGMNSQTKQAHIARAVFEGISFSALWLAQTLFQSADTTPKIINCGGGGFGSEVLNQIRADIFGIKLKTTSTANPGTLGAVALASIASGHFQSLEEATANIISFNKTYMPDTNAHARYTDKFELFKQAYYANRPINHALLKH